MYVFYFLSELDKRIVLLDEPWHFNNCLVVLEEPKNAKGVVSMKFNLQDFWVQVYNVPLVGMSKMMGIQIGSRIG